MADMNALVGFSTHTDEEGSNTQTVAVDGGTYLGRYWGLGVGYMFSFLQIQSQLEWDDPLRKKGAFNALFLKLRLRPSTRLVVDIGGGPTFASLNVDGGVEYEADEFFAGNGLYPFCGLSVY